MTKHLPRVALRILGMSVILVVVLGLFSGARGLGWLAPIGISSESSDSQVIVAIERTEQVALVSLGIQGLKDKSQSTDIGGWPIPGTTKRVWLEYTFRAKLGLDGSKVDVSKTGAHSYRIEIPEFIFIGYDEPMFRVALEDNDFGYATPDIDQAEMVSEILNAEAQDEYISSNQELLQDQATTFYDSLIASIDPEARTTYVFQP